MGNPVFFFFCSQKNEHNTKINGGQIKYFTENKLGSFIKTACDYAFKHFLSVCKKGLNYLWKII